MNSKSALFFVHFGPGKLDYEKFFPKTNAAFFSDLTLTNVVFVSANSSGVETLNYQPFDRI